MKDLRRKRIEEAYKRELAGLIQREKLKNDRIGFVSIVRVHIDDDLNGADVFVSPFGSDEENELTLKALAECAPRFQSVIGKHLHLRQTPRMRIVVDTSIREGDAILEIIESFPPSKHDTDQ